MTIQLHNDQPVSVSLEELKQGSVTLDSLEKAFGQDSLGIIIVRDLPEKFAALRSKLLSYSSYLGNLPAEELLKLEHPDAKYLVGWSHGKETLRPGHFDVLKGSYYVNCAFYKDPKLQGAPSENYPSFPEYTASNVWPAEDVLQSFRETFEELCTLIIDTAVLVARACDTFGAQRIPDYDDGYLEHVVKTSMTTKARLLHYFPSSNTEDASQSATEAEDDDWCATHLDHGCLTGLTSALYVDEAANSPVITKGATPSALPELASAPDPQAGLYIHSRSGKVTKVAIPRDCLAFQTGEALQVITKGHFKAVPHFVRGLSKETSGRIARNTLAVFTQPNLWEIVDKDAKKDFAAFAREIVSKNT